MHQNATKFEEIYSAYYRSLLKLIKRKICCTELAEDVLQEAFIKIWNSLPEYDPGKGGLYTWMAAICNNMAIDQMRSIHYRNQFRTSELELMIETVDGQQFFLPNTDLIDVIAHARKLRQSYADILMLSYQAGYSHVEIGGLLNIPLGTVKSRIRIAVGLLRQLYSPLPKKKD